MLILGRPSSQASVETVHVVFSCHLDVGFGIFPTTTPGLDSTVLNTYFHEHFPNAIRVAEELRSRGGPERLVFLTHVGCHDCPALPFGAALPGRLVQSGSRAVQLHIIVRPLSQGLGN